MEPVHVMCQCGQKLALNITEKHLGKTLEATCPCSRKTRVQIPKVIHDGNPPPPPPKKADTYDYDPLAGRSVDAFPPGSVDDFIDLFGKGKDFPFFGK